VLLIDRSLGFKQVQFCSKKDSVFSFFWGFFSFIAINGIHEGACISEKKIVEGLFYLWCLINNFFNPLQKILEFDRVIRVFSYVLFLNFPIGFKV